MKSFLLEGSLPQNVVICKYTKFCFIRKNIVEKKNELSVNIKNFESAKTRIFIWILLFMILLSDTDIRSICSLYRQLQC